MILYKITVYFRLVDEDISEEAPLSISDFNSNGALSYMSI